MLQCMLWSWYLANDTQFYIIGILILLISVRFDTSLSVSMQHVFSCFYYIIIIFYYFMRKFIQMIQKSSYFKYRQPVKVTAALCNQLVQPSAIVIRSNSPVHTSTMKSCSQACRRFYCCAQLMANCKQKHRVALLEAYFTNESYQHFA